jgi:farnesyl diphosphate synthase
VEFDEATALLAGDALQSFAFQLMSEYRLRRQRRGAIEDIHLFAAAAGSRGMAGGQAIDLDRRWQVDLARRARVHAHP